MIGGWTHERIQCFSLDTRREEKRRHAIVQLCYTTIYPQREPVLLHSTMTMTNYDEKVELIAPNLMLEKVTVESALFFSTSAGAPESLEQVPRLTPGVLSVALVG